MANTGDVYNAIKTLWEASSTLDGIGGPYRDREPPDGTPAFPYCIFKTLPATRGTTTNKSSLWTLRFSFNVYHRTAELCATNLDLIQAVFDDWATTLTGGKGSVLVTRDVGEDIGEEDKGVNRGTLTFQLTYRRPKG
jgi:hypothetical protein